MSRIRNPLGASWLPKVSGILLGLSPVVIANTKNETVREIAVYAGALGGLLVGTTRQNNVRSERVLKPASPTSPTAAPNG